MTLRRSRVAAAAGQNTVGDRAKGIEGERPHRGLDELSGAVTIEARLVNAHRRSQKAWLRGKAKLWSYLLEAWLVSF